MASGGLHTETGDEILTNLTIFKVIVVDSDIDWSHERLTIRVIAKTFK